MGFLKIVYVRGLELFYYPLLDRVLFPFFKKKVDSKQIESIILMFGTYRNLTTLIASIYSIHPNCLVLNHAGERVLWNNKLNFIKNPQKEVYQNFIDFAFYAQKHGRKGVAGGDIEKSHAFRKKKMKEAKDLAPSRGKIKHIFWKEPYPITKNFLDGGKWIEKIFKRFPHVQMIMPIRNPLDCSISYINTGMNKELIGHPQKKMEVAQHLVDIYASFGKLQKRYKDRLFYFTQEDMGKKWLKELAQHSKMKVDKRWVKAASHALDLKQSYEHSPDEIAQLDKMLNKCEPELKKDIMKMVYDCQKRVLKAKKQKR
jgi:hypothetical protein